MMVRDAVAGDRIVKEKGVLYLPRPCGFKGMENPRKEYEAYKLRAQFPRITAPTLRGMLGVIHRKEADIKLPKALEQLWEKATPDGAPLEALHKRIPAALPATGRYTLFGDAPSDGESDTPFIAGYDAEHLINWSRFG